MTHHTDTHPDAGIDGGTVDTPDTRSGGAEPVEPSAGSHTTAGSDTPHPPTADAATISHVSAEVRNWSTAAHLSGLVLFAGIPSFLGPLVVWLVKREDPYVEAQAKEALNFNISFLAYAVVAAISIVGLLVLPVIFLTWLVLVVVAAVRSADGEGYRYPLTMRFVR